MANQTLRSAAARAFWKLARWKLVRESATVDGPRLLIGAPHTSNIDFALMLGIAWDARMRIHWLGKRQLFRGLAGPLMRALGGIAVDRDDPSRVVAEVVDLAQKESNFLLVVTPEGTRQGKGWRSGLPVTLGYVDGDHKCVGLGPTMELTGDVVADMDRIRAFYRDKKGVRPQYTTEPRLRDEAGLTAMLAEDERSAGG